jgi:hypothetical protein
MTEQRNSMYTAFTHLIMDSIAVCLNVFFFLFLTQTWMIQKTIFGNQSTNLVIVNLCSLLGSMCHTLDKQNNVFWSKCRLFY